MNKFILAAVFFLSSDIVLAGGRLLFKPVYEKSSLAEEGRWSYNLGLPVTMDIPFLPLRYEGYTGLVVNNEKKFQYGRFENGFAYSVPTLTVGVSATMDQYVDYRVCGGFGYVSIELW